MVLSKLSLKDSIRIDFTGTVAGFDQYRAYGDEIVGLVRRDDAPSILIVIDRGFGMQKPVAHIVRDHLNLTGFSPLVGPNDPCGERFPSVNDIYITDLLPELPRAVAAGLKPQVVPSAQEAELAKSLGADLFCYNLVPVMIVAAHAKRRVLGIILPEGCELDPKILESLEIGGGK
jgi:purine-nucleoside phosphorylase